MKTIRLRSIKGLLPILLMSSALCACAQTPKRPTSAPITQSEGLSAKEIAAISQDAMTTFHTPGMAVAVVENGRMVYADGFGVRDITSNDAVTENTLFRIASTTKAFTAAALAILVDDGRLDWDDKVRDHLPGFRMYDPWVTQEFTIRDLLTHRSGLGLGAGDLMLWPEPSGFSRTELVHNLRYLKPKSSFRSKYAYDNLLYIVAGEVVAAAANISWENFVQSRILEPLNINCYAGNVAAKDKPKLAVPYGYIDETLVEITRNRVENASNVSGPAGGLVCSARGMSTWMLTQLSGGVGPNGKRIFSQAQRDEMWRGVTILTVGASERTLDRTHFKTYALGWRKEDMHGYEVVSHTGTLSGFQAYLALVPELNVGVIVLNNGSNSGARAAVVQSVLKAYMGQPHTDWVTHYKAEQAKRAAARTANPANDNNPVGSGQLALPLTAYAGLYQDPWFGGVDIVQEGAVLRFRSRKMVKLVGTLEPFEGNTFIVRWDDPEFRADAYMDFTPTPGGRVTGATMRHVSANGDWSFDFEDLNFTRY